MQTGTSKWVMALAFVALLVGGCASRPPVYNVTDAPVAAPRNATNDDVKKAIIRAGSALGWQMKETAPGQIVGTLNLRKHMAVVDIPYSTKSYSIKYRDSAELDYDGSHIHKNYNGWIMNLQKGIDTQLRLL